MSHWLSEQAISCPFCGETITVLIDTSAGSQNYIEDCQVCCRPIQINVAVADDELLSVDVDCAS